MQRLKLEVWRRLPARPPPASTCHSAHPTPPHSTLPSRPPPAGNRGTRSGGGGRRPGGIPAQPEPAASQGGLPQQHRPRGRAAGQAARRPPPPLPGPQSGLRRPRTQWPRTPPAHQPLRHPLDRRPRPAPAPPSQTPFRIALPRHLPECIHLPNSHGINYSLTATLTYHRLNHHHPPVPRKASLTIPIHIPACPDHPPQAHQAFSLSPVEISTLQPTPIFLTISHTLLRHAEPLALQIRIPPPTEQLVTDKGLQLRSVRAELRRHIRPRSAPEQQVTTVLAISGKSCRFSSSRAVFLRLRLHSCLASTRGRAGTVGARHGEEEGLATEREGVPRCPTVSQTRGCSRSRSASPSGSSSRRG
ncbi:hypothetical protein PTTG_30654, partial [Puccinia triticina 1-1 BBBD Race 1]